MSIPKRDCWDAIVDYYYDNVHWSEDHVISINQWLERDYGATTSHHNQFIHFKSPAKEAWFKLRWM